jgi:monoamine oxidase
MSDAGERRRPTRRSLAIGAGAGAGLLAARAALASQSTKPSARSSGYDVAIVGGGFAGLIAAREVRQAGLSAVVVEGRDRLGGRTYSEKIGGHVTEFGGTWVHWTQPHTWTEIQRYGLEIVETPGAQPQRFLFSRGGPASELPPADAVGALSSGMDRLLTENARLAFPRPMDPFFAAQEVARWSSVSVAEQIQRTALSPIEASLVGAFWETLGHCHLEELAYVEALREWALAGYDTGRILDIIGRYRLKDGTGALIEAIRVHGAPDIVLSEPIVRVEQGEKSARLLGASGRVFDARAVVVTAPLNVLKTIEFNPALNPAKQRHSAEGHAGHGVKGYAILRQDVGQIQGLASEPSLISSVICDAHGPSGSRVIFFGPDASRLDIGDRQAVQAALRTFIPDAEVTEVIGHDWAHDPYSLGTWCHFRPGQLSSYFPEDRSREGRLYFASGDTADGFRGYIDGAIERGIRVGFEVAEALRSENA